MQPFYVEGLLCSHQPDTQKEHTLSAKAEMKRQDCKILIIRSLGTGDMKLR